MRRLLLRAFALLTVVTIVVFFARDEIIEWLVPKIVSSNLGLELSVESIETSIQGKVVIRGVRSQSPESWAIVRDLDVDRVEAQLSPGRFFRGGLPLISLRAEGLSIEIDTTRPGPPGDPPSETKEDDGEPFRWPESWPEVEATDARVVLRTGALDATFADVAVTLDRSETGNELEARGAVSWSLDESSGSFPFGLSAGYRKGIVSGASLDLSGAETLRDGRIDLATLDLQATLVTGTGEAAVAIEGLRGDETKLRAHAKSFELAELLPRLGLETQPFRGSVSLDAEAALDHDDWLDSTLLVAGRLRDAAWQGR
ncbi:MAG TPA: hypothetical protein VK116_18475, partial [Planctomycetota bacterium]|nr:hypothetical protein [Planctomycetota bacterium]